MHVHYKIRTDPASEVGYEFTSQLYFDEAVTDEVHGHAKYSEKGRRNITNSSDRVFRRGGNEPNASIEQGGRRLLRYVQGWILDDLNSECWNCKVFFT